MTRKNDFADEMGRKYKEAMEVLCPNQERAISVLRRNITLETYPPYTGQKLCSPYHLLDLGCGGGEFISEMESYVSFVNGRGRINVTGVDNSPLMVEKARKILAKEISQGKARIVQADLTKYLEAMNLVGQTADIITYNFVLHNFTDVERERVLPLTYGALSRGGLLLMEDKIARTSLAQHERDYARQMRRIESLAEKGMPELVESWKEHYLVDNSPERRMVERDLKNTLKKIGYRKVRTLYRDGMEAIMEARK